MSRVVESITMSMSLASTDQVDDLMEEVVVVVVEFLPGDALLSISMLFSDFPVADGLF